MRIAIDARYLNDVSSGIARYSANLLQHLSRLDKKNEYVVFIHNSYGRRPRVGDNFEIVNCPSRPMSLRSFFTFQRMVRRHRCDFLHCLAPIAPLFGCPEKIITIHDIHPFTFDDRSYAAPFGHHMLASMVYRLSYPQILRSARWMISVSHATRASLNEILPGSLHDTIVVHSGVNERFFEPPEPTVSQLVTKKLNIPPRFLLYVGSAQPNKNIPLMLEAFHELRRRDPRLFEDLHFLLVVGNDKRFGESRRRIRQFNLQDFVRPLGPITEEENRVLLARAQGLFSVTVGEGFGFPILEAQAAGLPVLAARSGATPEVAGQAALLANPNDFEDVVRQLHRLLTDNPLRQRLKREGPENARRFSWKETARRVLEIYKMLM